MTADEPTSLDEPLEELRLALALVDDPLHRPAVIRLLERADGWARWDTDAISASAVTLHGPAIVWWFDVLDHRPDWSDEADRLVRDRASDLLAVRRDAVLGRLTSPSRGPGPHGAAAVAEVLRILGPVPALERAWLRWIEEGRFDGAHPDDAGATTVHALADTLRRCVADGVLTEDHALVHGALAYWSELLRSSDPERRRRGLRVMAALIALRHRFPAALPHMVRRALRHDASPEASLVRSGVDALVNGDLGRLIEVGERLAAALDFGGLP
ncbi:hypothetical protein [Actinomycetospora atypica]|uniref:DUF4020 domain-containing protein n=1 Tax=Actinomycetospora atypica TaxID=1290095 RepID=A0ABV9YFL4_9PSEU